MAETNSDKFIDVADFMDKVVGSYNDGLGAETLPADIYTARSFMPAGSGELRDFSYIAPDIPIFDPNNCTGCMECVTQCPDTAILAKVVGKSTLEEELGRIDDAEEREFLGGHFARTKKYHNAFEKQGQEPGSFGIFIDPTKCKGCAECVEVCGDRNALEMLKKTSENLPKYRRAFQFFQSLPETPQKYINERNLADMMLAERSLLYSGGAGSCMGCGEATAIRMMLAATSFIYGPDSVAIVAATGCNTVYGSTYPYNPYKVPWTNSLFENAPAVAMGLRLRWDQKGLGEKKIWVLGGDGAMLDIGFQSLSRMMASGMNLNVLVLDTQVYSNTGGQASTATFMGQDAKMSAHGKAVKGKAERRKELGQICIMHPDIFVAQTTCAHISHFYRAIMEANSYEGPSVINVFTTCQPEHGVADDLAAAQAKLAAESRAFPLFVHDPRKGPRIQDRMDLKGNPSVQKDWYVDHKRGTIDFIRWARSEGRFAKHFDEEGNPTPELLAAQEERLQNWHMLQELAGII